LASLVSIRQSPFNTNERKNYGHVDSTGSFSGDHPKAYHLETAASDHHELRGQESLQCLWRSVRDISALMPKQKFAGALIKYRFSAS